MIFLYVFYLLNFTYAFGNSACVRPINLNEVESRKLLICTIWEYLSNFQHTGNFRKDLRPSNSRTKLDHIGWRFLSHLLDYDNNFFTLRSPVPTLYTLSFNLLTLDLSFADTPSGDRFGYFALRRAAAAVT